MTFKAALVYSNDDGFSLAIEFLRATVAQRVAPNVDHQVWYHPSGGNLITDYLGHYNTFLAKLFAFAPDVVAFSAYVWNHDEFCRMSQMIRRYLPHTRIVWGGAQANSRRMAERLMGEYPWLDYVLRGEGEDSYPLLIDSLAADRDLANVPGLTWRHRKLLRHNVDAMQVRLDSIPIVFTPEAFALADVLDQPRPPTLAYETGRGCRQKCKFCLYGVPSLRAFSMDRIERELAFLLDGEVPFLRICDAHFGISRTRSMQLFEIIAKHNRRTVVDIYPDTKHVDLDYIRAMNRAGCRVVSLGIQSSDRESLAVAGRRFDEATFAAAARLIQDHHNSRLAADVIIGLPGDNYEKVKESVRFAYRHDIDTVHFAPLMAFPGVDFFERSEEYGIEYFPFQPPLVIQSASFSADDYRRSMVFASCVERIERETPTVLRCLRVSGADFIAFFEGLGHREYVTAGHWAFDTRFAEYVAACEAPLAEVMQDALAWDRAAALAVSAREVPFRWDDATRVVAIDEASIVRLRYRIDALSGWREPIDQLPRGAFAYLFLRASRTVYRLDGALAVAWDTVEPGLRFGEWRARMESAGFAAAAGEEAILTLALAGAVRGGRLAALRHEPARAGGAQLGAVSPSSAA